MAVDHRIIRNSENFRGIDKRTSDLRRTMEFATDIKNAAYRVSGAINKRKGFKTHTTISEGSNGATTYKKVDTTSGAVTDELLLVNNNLQRLKENNITILNNTELENIYFAIVAESNEIKFKLSNEGNSLLDASLNTGLTVDDKPMATLKTNIEGISNSTVILRKKDATIIINRVPATKYVVKIPGSLIITKRYAQQDLGMSIVFGGGLLAEFTESIAAINYNSGTDMYEYDITYTGTSSLESLSWDTVTDPALHVAQWEDLLRADASTPFPSFTIADDSVLENLEVATQTLKAALLDQVPFKALPEASQSVLLTYKTIETIPNGDSSVTDTFTGFTSGNAASMLASEDLENATFAQLNNVLYISNGIDNVMKYDGSSIYRAGLPTFPEDPADATYFDDAFLINDTGSSSTIDPGTYSYKLVLEYTDAVGNIITSQPSEFASKEITGSIDHFHVDFSNFVSTHIAGFDKDGTFDDTHPLFSSLNTGTRPAADQIGKWQGEKRLRVLIYRTKHYTAGTGGEFNQYYLVGDVPYDYDSSSHSGITVAGQLADHIEDADINNLLALPTIIKRKDPPPKGKYLTVFKDCLVVTGQNVDVNNLQFSLPFNLVTGEIGSEYFPDDANGVKIESSFGDKITACASLRDLLYIFHKNSIHVLGGDITAPDGIPFTVDLLTKEGGIGCQAHSSITEFRNQLIFLSNTGYYTIDASSALSEISSLIKPLFLDTSLKRQRSVSFNWTEENVLVMIIPKESLDNNGNIYTLSTSLVIAYDYYKDAWLQWDNVDFTSGAALFKDQLFILGKQDSLASLSSMNNSGTTFDYIDHTTPISFEYDTNWESLAEPTVPKKFLRLKVYSQDTDAKFESPSFDIDLKVQLDYLPTDLGTINLDFGAIAGGGWGESKWGEFPWGNVSGRGIKTKLPARKAKCMKLRFTNNKENENVLITNYELEVATPYRQEIKD